MKLAVFGATGGTGRQIVKQALERGYKITALCREPKRLGIQHENLSLMQGDALDYEAVLSVVRDQDAALCALGKPNILDKSKLRSKATAHIVKAMEEAKTRRLICLSSLGAGDSFALLPFTYQYIVVPLMMRQLYEDHNTQEGIIRNSHLDWSIVRPGKLTNGLLTGKYHHGFAEKDVRLSLKISRADTAEFMLRQLEDGRYFKAAPCLSY